METNKYKITVLTDLKESAMEALKSTISFAKMIDADIEVFHVKKPTDIVKHESQLSAFRTINEQHTSTKKRLEDLISSVSDKEINLQYSYTFGNVKNEIADYLTQYKPDIIVLGKRNSKSLNLNGDSLTNFIIKTHKGAILITGNDNILGSNQKLSLGILNGRNVSIDSPLGQDLLSLSQTPLKVFSFIKQDNQSGRASKTQPNTKTVEYVFEHNDNTIKNLSNFLAKTNINILYLDRENKPDGAQGLKQSDIKSVVNGLKTPILLSSYQSKQLTQV
ncbi:MAG: universal stress protein [Xanthomarina gelatinilytica]|uniref:universal stress protein n=1 Tax=Xanthomarina gelatinilytica TaxID=1137281 RepID=UPI003A8C1D25